MNNNILNIATVFSGIGSVEHALERLRIPHNIIFACDNDKFVKQSYFANYKLNENQWFDDIKNLDGNKYKNNIDLFVGGSPCQSFSMVGKRKGLEDFRGLLVFEFIRLLKEIQPKIFIFENVKGLLNHNKGKTWELISKEFISANYIIHYKVLNAKDYGIPQNRERVFVISIRKDIDKCSFNFPDKQFLKIRLKDLLEEKVDNKYYLSDKAIGRLIRHSNKIIRNNETPKICSCLVAGYFKMGGRDQQYVKDDNVKRIAGIFDEENKRHQAGSIYDKNRISSHTHKSKWRTCSATYFSKRRN